tara:strand:- start:86 stop:217 length:132 start_codon:yes stop_codon:yes gene_type:complete
MAVPYLVTAISQVATVVVVAELGEASLSKSSKPAYRSVRIRRD